MFPAIALIRAHQKRHHPQFVGVVNAIFTLRGIDEVADVVQKSGGDEFVFGAGAFHQIGALQRMLERGHTICTFTFVQIVAMPCKQDLNATDQQHGYQAFGPALVNRASSKRRQTV